MMDFSNEMNGNDEDSIRINQDIELSIDDLKEMIEQMNQITNNGDMSNIILPEKVDLIDLNPYEPSSIDEKSENNLHYFHSLPFDIDSCTTSTSLVLPHNQIHSSNSFEQFWSARVYSPQLIDSKTSESITSLLLSKLFLIGLSLLNPCIRILQYDTVFFAFSYLIGALLGTHAYYLLDFFLIVICIISILVGTYEKWLFHYLSCKISENSGNSTESNNRYWWQIKLAAYGLVIGTISTMIV